MFVTETTEVRKKRHKVEIQKLGLYGAIKTNLDEIIDVCQALDYRRFGKVLYSSTEILELLKEFKESVKKY